MSLISVRSSKNIVFYVDFLCQSNYNKIKEPLNKSQHTL